MPAVLLFAVFLSSVDFFLLQYQLKKKSVKVRKCHQNVSLDIFVDLIWVKMFANVIIRPQKVTKHQVKETILNSMLVSSPEPKAPR